MIQITCKGNGASCTRTERLTSGMVGLQCEFIFDEAWDGLAKTAVFLAGSEQRDVMLTGTICDVPPEVMRKPGYQLVISVYGTNADGTLVIPTCYAMCGGIGPGADPSGDESTDPTLPVWGQLRGMIGNLADLETASKDNLVAAINEAAQSGGGGGSAVALDTTLTQSGKAADAKAVGTALAEKMPLPASAAVGQYFVVSAVDENGAVTAVQAVDKPSGGGGSGWREVIDYTVDAETHALTITTDKNGLPFNLREAVLFIEAVGNAETETFYSVVSTDQAVNVSWGSGTQLFTVPGLASKMERQNYIARFIALGSATLPVTAMKTSTSNYVDNFMPDRVSNGESCGFNGKNAGNYTKIDQLKFVSYARILNAGARVRLWGVDA